MNGLRFSPDTNIRDLRGKPMLALRDALDTAPETQNWRALAASLKAPYVFKHNEIEKMAMRIYSHESPSSELILELGARGMVVSELVKYLDMLRLEKVLQEFKDYEPIKITSEPEEELKLFEGETLTLSVEATGFPYPKYQWFHENSEVKGAVEKTLKIENVCESQKGFYCCRLHNCADPKKVKFTHHCYVEVYPDYQNSSAKPGKMHHDEKNDIVFQDNSKNCNLPVIEDQPKDVVVLKGHPFIIKCRARSCFRLSYFWYHDGSYFIQTEDPELQIDSAVSSHNGRYHCIVRNNFGEARTNICMVMVAEYDMPQLTKEPEILNQPKSCSVQLGGVALFVVEACGIQPVSYQWFKDSVILRDQTASELRIANIMSYEQQGMYYCIVKNNYGKKISDGALLTVISSPPRQYFAKDKVALLIGNYFYKAENSLSAPKQDIKTLCEIFRNLQFKVVSLLNLTKTEMISAVQEFCRLIDDGVYCVFYFCGHGFEESGQCYLVPEDAPTGFTWEHCLCADFVLDRMKNRNPAICCMILDICRRKNELSSNEVPNFIKSGSSPAGNTIICYATSSGYAAYEQPHYGIMVHYLQRHLQKPISIEQVFLELRTDITRDQQCRGKQIPEVRTTLSEPMRSLADKIQYHGGGTQAYHKRQLLWEAAHRRPPTLTVEGKPKELGIVLELDFQSEFSNVLHVYVTVKKKDKIADCIAWVAKIPNTLSIMDQPCEVTGKDCEFRKTKNIIQDIQKLKESMEIAIAVKYRRLNSSHMEITDCETVNLGFPLISELQLWKPRTSTTSAHPVEQNEDS